MAYRSLKYDVHYNNIYKLATTSKPNYCSKTSLSSKVSEGLKYEYVFRKFRYAFNCLKR